MPKTLLTVSGLDPSGGAGLHADVKTAKSLGLHASSVVTALTIQNSCGVKVVHAVEPDILADQLEFLLADIDFSAIKIGMVPNVEIAEILKDFLKDIDAPKVLDPVMYAGAGGKLGNRNAYLTLLPVVNVITPNLSEARIIANMNADAETLAKKLAEYGCDVVITGGELGGKDIVFDSGRIYRVEAEFSPVTIHGTGCVYSTALACYLTSKKLEDAVRFARLFVLESVKRAVRVGKCFPFVNP